MANNYERIVWDGGITKKFEFYYGYEYASGEIIPVRENRAYKIIYTNDKKELYFDLKNNQIVRYKNPTLFAQYKKAKKSLERETYLKPHEFIVTDKMREKGLVQRYFAKFIFDGTIMEISKQFSSMKIPYYQKILITWKLNGTKEQILESNTKSLRVADGVLEGMRYHLDPLEFYEEEITLYEEIEEKLGRLQTGY
tara:strand:- start:11 stop:598 length:588 start_codon:yes stop_codon:yes gene_type:complete